MRTVIEWPWRKRLSCKPERGRSQKVTVTGTRTTRNANIENAKFNDRFNSQSVGDRLWVVLLAGAQYMAKEMKLKLWGKRPNGGRFKT